MNLSSRDSSWWQMESSCWVTTQNNLIPGFDALGLSVGLSENSKRELNSRLFMPAPKKSALDAVADAMNPVPVSFSSQFSRPRSAARTIADFKRDRCSSMALGTGPRLHTICPFGSVFGELYSRDTASLDQVIQASYRQVFGNVPPTENERCTELESRLRQGDINVREFVAGLAKSTFYKDKFFHSVAPQRGVELNFKHLLGRPPVNQAEVSRCITLLADQGFDAVVDHLTDSGEYAEVFGNDIVPFTRGFQSAAGQYNSTFSAMVELQHATASSDRTKGSASLLMYRLGAAQRSGISSNPTYVYTRAMAPKVSENFFNEVQSPSLPVSYKNFSYSRVARAASPYAR